MRIACVGGGPAGLYFAILTKLSDPANSITVFERNKEGITHGWGVTLEEPFVARLAELDRVSAAQIESRAIRWRDQIVNFRGGVDLNPDNGDAFGVSRQWFVEVLAKRAVDLGVTIRYEQEIPSISALESLAPDADLIVAADGVSSQVRSIGPDFGTTVTEGQNKYIWLGTGKVFDGFNFFFEQTHAGWIWAYAYGHEAAASTFIVECEPKAWTGLGFYDCSPAQMLDKLEKIFAGPLDGRRLWAQFSSESETQWLSFRTVRNERWHDGKVVLVGDAAHTAHYSVGLGTTLAVQDAIALAAHLRRVGCRSATAGEPSGIPAALDAYQQERAGALARHATEADRSARWFESISRYGTLTPTQFARVLHARRAPLLPRIPPRLFCYLHSIRANIAVADKTRTLLNR